MKKCNVTINWPNGVSTYSKPGKGWIESARKAGIEIPMGCLKGSCGACEIEVNGEVTRACINTIPTSNEILNIKLYTDPYW